MESWGALAERIHAEIDRGQKIVVQGRLKVNSWTDMSGTKKKSVRVRAGLVWMLCGRERKCPWA